MYKNVEDSELVNNLRCNIVFLRQASGLTITEFADAVGVSKDTIINLESGKAGNIFTLSRIVALCNCSWDYLFTQKTGKETTIKITLEKEKDVDLLLTLIKSSKHDIKSIDIE